MSALVNALDTHTPNQIGENAHQEYGWSNDIREKVLQFSFQLNRTRETTNLEAQLRSLLTSLTKTTSIIGEAVSKELLVTLFKMIGHTRDIIDGKGEYTLAYMMICTWYDFYPELASYALRTFVMPDLDKNMQPYGSWKDIKYFCNFCRARGWSLDHPMIVHAIEMVNMQLHIDSTEYAAGRFENLTLLCKWITRETSGKFGWLYSALATGYFKHYLDTAKTGEAYVKATKKAKMEYRKLIASINRVLDTIQIKQCGGEWSGINFNKVTSITFSKQKKALLNVKKDGSQRYELEDRILCSENFKEHIALSITGEKEVKGKRIGLNTFTQQATQLLLQGNNSSTNAEIDLLNSQWRDNSSQTGALGNMIAMVDTSGSMSGDPIHAAIALGYRVAEKSLLGKRIMTFSNTPTWVNLDGCDNFVSAVQIISRANWGMNTNFHVAFDMILDSCVQKKLDANIVANMVLVIFSDMQMDAAGNSGTLYDVMEEKYADAGIRAVGKPYKPPHILFWNLRSTSGFPALSSRKNISMMSGFSPALLNLFCEKGIDALQSCTPWSILMESLNNKRYWQLEYRAVAAI